MSEIDSCYSAREGYTACSMEEWIITLAALFTLAQYYTVASCHQCNTLPRAIIVLPQVFLLMLIMYQRQVKKQFLIILTTELFNSLKLCKKGFFKLNQSFQVTWNVKHANS